MHTRTRFITMAATLCAAALLVSCGDDKKPVDSGKPVPVFSLVDVNPNSATHEATVSPRDHLGRVSAWYFGHAT